MNIFILLENFNVIAKKFEVNFYSCGNIHIFTPNKINRVLCALVCEFYFLIFPLIQLIMSSKTIEDMNNLKRLMENK